MPLYIESPHLYILNLDLKLQESSTHLTLEWPKSQNDYLDSLYVSTL